MVGQLVLVRGGLLQPDAVADLPEQSAHVTQCAARPTLHREVEHGRVKDVGVPALSSLAPGEHNQCGNEEDPTSARLLVLLKVA